MERAEAASFCLPRPIFLLQPMKRHFALPYLISALACQIILTHSPAAAAEVTVEICEQGLKDTDAWPANSLAATESFTVPAFALDLLPQKYVGDGVRGERPSPSLLRFTGQLTLPAGQHRWLVRSRSAARLWINGQQVVETPFAPKDGGDGSQHDTERREPLDLGAGYRFAPRGEYERIAEFTVSGGPCEVRLEAFVGGREGKKARRVELGETVAAVALQGTGEWRVLAPGEAGFPYTDAALQRYQQSTHASITARDAAKRAELRASHDAVWKAKQTEAARWLSRAPAVAVPALPKGFTAGNPVDHFIAAKFAEVRAANQPTQQGAVDYFRQVKPLLEARCAECHRGAKAKGGLSLESLAATLKGGDSGPALLQGKGQASELIHRLTTEDEDEIMPPKGNRLTHDEVALLTRWIDEGASWPEQPLVRETFTPLADDYSFMRRVMLDLIGLPPSEAELLAFVSDASPDKRTRLVDRLLKDPRWADAWMPMWQDLLAENPNILNPTLNNTGPFRWWLYEALSDDLPLDRLVTQLITLQGSAATGGPAGFGLASQNDAPFAAKGTVISAAFMGVEMKCARCHDSATGMAKQEQLFQLGAMLAGHDLDVPKTSSVDPAKLHAGGRKALIEVTLKPGSKVKPHWPFDAMLKAETKPAAATPQSSREQLAAMLTAPANERFAQVVVNRLWARLMGRGIVEPLDDWEKGKPTHPELLRWLGRELVRADYQAKPILRLIALSQAYQRATDVTLRAPDPLYSAPEPRRLLAEQVVDSLVTASGKTPRLEPLCLDLNGRRDTDNSVDLGTPKRAWMLASLSNERDRPSLNLPRLQAITDVLSALGWRGARQDPASTRDTQANALQPAILANGVLGTWLVRLSDDHALTQLACEAKAPGALVDSLYLRLLGRLPTKAEHQRYEQHLSVGFDQRLVVNAKPAPQPHTAPRLVTWTNHLLPEANQAKTEMEAEAKQGDRPTSRLTTDWRQRCEDCLWAIMNAPEVLFRP